MAINGLADYRAKALSAPLSLCSGGAKPEPVMTTKSRLLVMYVVGRFPGNPVECSKCGSVFHSFVFRIRVCTGIGKELRE